VRVAVAALRGARWEGRHRAAVVALSLFVFCMLLRPSLKCSMAVWGVGVGEKTRF